MLRTLIYISLVVVFLPSCAFHDDRHDDPNYRRDYPRTNYPYEDRRYNDRYYRRDEQHDSRQERNEVYKPAPPPATNNKPYWDSYEKERYESSNNPSPYDAHSTSPNNPPNNHDSRYERSEVNKSVHTGPTYQPSSSPTRDNSHHDSRSERYEASQPSRQPSSSSSSSSRRDNDFPSSDSRSSSGSSSSSHDSREERR